MESFQHVKFLEMMQFLLHPVRASPIHRTVREAANLVAKAVSQHWVYCNVYTVKVSNIVVRVEKLYGDFLKLLKVHSSRRTSFWSEKATEFNRSSNLLFDIFCDDSFARKKLENEHGVSMTKEDFAFLEDQRTSRIGYCSSFTDRQWQKTIDRKRKIENSHREMELRSLKDIQMLNTVSLFNFESSDDDDDDVGHIHSVSVDEQSDDDSFAPEQKSKRRRTFHCVGNENDPLPTKFQHLRERERKVKDSVYLTIDRLVCHRHLSLEQACGALVDVGNFLFLRNWKTHSENSENIDFDTLPHHRNISEKMKSFEAAVLREIAQEIFTAESAVVTYHDDCSRKQGAGAYSVQGITIHGKFRPLPTLRIAAETRQNLADLKVTILRMLSAVSDIAPDILYSKIDFVMTDSTAHNFHVENLVSQSLETDHTPAHLVCNVHCALMFNRILMAGWRDIESKIGHDKIFSNVLNKTASSNSSATVQMLDCMMRLISHDFDDRPWNKSAKFDQFI